MILDAYCKLRYQAPAPVPATFMLRPRSGWAQWIIREEFLIEPLLQVVEYTDLYGNLSQRVIMPEGPLTLTLSCRAAVPDAIDTDLHAPITPVEQLPADVLHYLLPSRYCESDKMGDLAQTITNNAPQTYERAATIRTWIQHNVKYQYGTSDSGTSALNTAESRIGVCRDFAHLGIALCRSINIPARMVVGFLHELEPMDLHAWFEAFVGGRWFTLDATQDAPKGNRIVVAYGRDAADVAISTIYGACEYGDMEVSVKAVQPD